MKTPLDVENKKVLVVGLARSGVAAAKLLCKHKGIVTVTDQKAESELQEALAELDGLGVTIEVGGHQVQSFEQAELIVLSPGVPMEQDVLQQAAAAGTPIISELELGYRFCKGKVAAVTGTNGKTTTVHLLHQMFEDAGIPCVLAGNVGVPFTAVAESLPSNGVVVLEVSSFQLETIDTFRPDIATILNITPDHLDRYSNMQFYVEAKASIMKNQLPNDIIVLNGEDKYTPLLSTQAEGRVLTFSSQRPPEIEGCWVEDSAIHYRIFGLGQGVIMLADELLIPGPHNLENALAAIVMGLAFGIKPKDLLKTLRHFKGVEHRLEPIGTIDGIKYVNDSKATNVDAVSKALESYTNQIVLILGGRDKQGDFTKLIPMIEKHVAAIVVMGEAAGVIENQLKGVAKIVSVKNLEEAVKEATSCAGEGQVVLLSPGCASFDQFKNFEERGKAFKELVRVLKESNGEQG